MPLGFTHYKRYFNTWSNVGVDWTVLRSLIRQVIKYPDPGKIPELFLEALNIFRPIAV
jgi:hypothetical protein